MPDGRPEETEPPSLRFGMRMGAPLQNTGSIEKSSRKEVRTSAGLRSRASCPRRLGRPMLASIRQRLIVLPTQPDILVQTMEAT